MREQTGNLWTFHQEKRWIVITTNIGFKKDGTNPMGAGVAKQAAEKYEDLPAWYGKKCKKYRADTAVQVYRPGKLFLFPTKPFDPSQPWMSWKQDSSLDLIRRSAKQLAAVVEKLGDEIFGDIGIPLVGCQNGNLRRRDVMPILKEYLDDRFVLLELPDR